MVHGFRSDFNPRFNRLFNKWRGRDESISFLTKDLSVSLSNLGPRRQSVRHTETCLINLRHTVLRSRNFTPIILTGGVSQQPHYFTQLYAFYESFYRPHITYIYNYNNSKVNENLTFSLTFLG